jgi:hypothetical protein
MYLQINIQQAHFMEVLVLKNLHCSREHGFSSKKIYIASNGVPHMGNLALTMSVCKPKPGGFP